MMKCLCLLLVLPATLLAAPIDDLASPDQATRDAAAKIQRATYKPPPRAKWEPLLTALKPGMTQKALADLMSKRHLKCDPYQHFNRAGFQSCRLDNGWLLVCLFKDLANGALLNQAKLIADIKGFDIQAPLTFTGTWTTYYANGQKDIEAQVHNGQFSGNATGYASDGMLNWLGRYDAGVCTDENYYYPSGRIKTRTLHTPQSDFITYYRENGSVASTDTEPNNGQPHVEPFVPSIPSR